MSREESLTKMLSTLEAINPLTKLLREAILDNTHERILPGKATLLYEGGTQNLLWFLARGFAREYRNNPVDWQETTNWFWQSGDFVFHENYFSGERSVTSIDFYPHSTLLEIDVGRLWENISLRPEISLMRQSLSLHIQTQKQEHLFLLAHLTKMEHVKKFYANHKLLFNFVRHRDLASFLGIKDKSIYRYLKGL